MAELGKQAGAVQLVLARGLTGNGILATISVIIFSLGTSSDVEVYGGSGDQLLMMLSFSLCFYVAHFSHKIEKLILQKLIGAPNGIV